MPPKGYCDINNVVAMSTERVHLYLEIAVSSPSISMSRSWLLAVICDNYQQRHWWIQGFEKGGQLFDELNVI